MDGSAETPGLSYGGPEVAKAWCRGGMAGLENISGYFSNAPSIVHDPDRD
jgi:hypothetical protein